MAAVRTEAAFRFRALAMFCCALTCGYAWAQAPGGPGGGTGGVFYPGPPSSVPPPSGAPGAAPPGQPGTPPAIQGGAPPVAPGAAPGGSKRAIPIDAHIVEVRIVGNRQHTVNEIIGMMGTKAGRPFDQARLERDVRLLATKGWFLDVKTRKDVVPGGVIVTVEVVEKATIEYVKFLGHRKVGRMALARQVELKKGSPLDPYAVGEGQKKLEDYYRGKGFNAVRVRVLEGNRPDDRGVVYLIHEGPEQKISAVAFEGNAITTDGRLKTQIASKPPLFKLFKGEVDHKKIDEDVEKLTAYYRGLGFFRAHVGRELEWNDKENKLTLTFVIDEGPRAKVRSVKILGNNKYTTEQLQPELVLKENDYFDQTKLTKDVTTLRDVYGGQGYVFCDVQPETRVLEDATALDMVYNISEGGRYRVSRINVHIEGTDGVNPHTSHRTVLNRLSLHPGDIIDVNKLRQSERRLKASNLFASDPSKGQPPRIIFTPPDDENPDGSSERVARRKKKKNGSGGSYRGQSPDPEDEEPAPRPAGFWRSLSKPANAESDAQEPSDAEANDSEPPPRWRRIEIELTPDGLPPATAAPPAAQPIAQPSVIPSTPGAAYVPSARPVPPSAGVAAPAAPGRAAASATTSKPRPLNPNFGPAAAPRAASGESIASRSPGNRALLPAANAAPPMANGSPPVVNASTTTIVNASPTMTSAPSPSGSPLTTPHAAIVASASAAANIQDIPPKSLAGDLFSVNPFASTGPVFRGQDPGSVPGGLPPGAQPGGLLPPGGLGGNPLSGGTPINDQPDRYIPLDVITTETQTGRFMFGAGINSNAGLIGNITIDEQNFDWRRVPSGFEDFRNGTAFRGAGQRFNVSANPGTIIQRYSVNFAEPYLWDTPVQYGLGGAYFQRYYQNWTETRSGGQTSLGYQITPDLSGSVNFSGDDVRISNPSNPEEPQLNRVLGHSTLMGVTGRLTYDTRDNTFFSTEGRYYSLALEQAFGTWTYPQVMLDVRRFMTLHQRPDGSGRHVLAFLSNFGIQGNNAPLYSHFFMGGIGTIRGFYYRGASTVDQGVIVGGTSEALATLEYVFPITADDMLRGTIFVDGGVLENGFHYAPESFRLAPGIGIMLNVPALGPAPIAIGVGIPVIRNPSDTLQYFYFSMGFGR